MVIFQQFFPIMCQKERKCMSKNKSKIITAESLREEITTLIKQDQESDGAWNTFMLYTIKDMMQDYDVMVQYLCDITKEQFDFICEAIDEVVYHFQKPELIGIIENLYHKFYGDDKSTAFFRDNIEGLRNCIKNTK